MGINRSGYYKWLNRDKNQYELNRIDITNMARQIHKEHPSYGYHAIAAEIRKNTGWIISDNLVHKCCKFEGIKSKMRHYKWKNSGEEHYIYENEIMYDWKTQHPLEKIVSDMTVIRHRNIKYEWTYFLDVYNNSIIAWDISAKQGDIKPYYTCRDRLIEIIKKEELQDPLYFHTDQGTVYSSKAFNQAFQFNNNIIRSMSRAGTPTDNPIIESINGWIKAQIRCDYKINEWSTIKEFLEYYVHYYNYERPAYKLGYKNPAQFTIEQGFIPIF
jgi:hypothetical protein